MKKQSILYLLLFSAVWLKAQDSAHPLQISFFCTNWGMDVPWDTFCGQLKAAGFDGVETWLPADSEHREEMVAALEKYELELILLSGGRGSTFETYLETYVANLKLAAQYRPRLINCHTGKDYFTFDQNRQLIDTAAAIGRESGVEVVHETHRGRFSFAAHITRSYLERLPGLSLTLDISHWCNVHESMLADQAETVELALSRTRHIHARVGHPQGPQVNDPRAPEWKEVVQQHLKWWDQVLKYQQQTGKATLTITTEFGPPAYMPVLPYTKQPVANQWSINNYMLNLLKTRYTE